MLSIHLPFLQVMLDAVHPPSFAVHPPQVMLDAVHPPSFLPFPLKSCLMLSIHLPFLPLLDAVMLDAVMLDAVHPPSFPSLSSHA